MPTTDTPTPPDAAVQTWEGLAPGICSALDWLAVSMRQLEGEVRNLSPDPNSAYLLTCRTALRNAEEVIKSLAPKMPCPHCKSDLLWSEDRGPHCDGCDDFQQRRYRKRPVVITAVQYRERMRVAGRLPDGVFIVPMPGEGDVPVIHTLEGDMIVRDGDYVITGVKGEKYPCKPDIFAATYESVDEENEKLTDSRPR